MIFINLFNDESKNSNTVLSTWKNLKPLKLVLLRSKYVTAKCTEPYRPLLLFNISLNFLIFKDERSWCPVLTCHPIYPLYCSLTHPVHFADQISSILNIKYTYIRYILIEQNISLANIQY